MLAQRRRRWANTKPTVVHRLIFAGQESPSESASKFNVIIFFLAHLYVHSDTNGFNGRLEINVSGLMTLLIYAKIIRVVCPRIVQASLSSRH